MSAVPESAARLSPECEAEIAARAEASTKGPWSVSPDYSDVLASDGEHLASYWHEADGQFMAHAREDVHALLAELAAVRAERDQTRARVAQLEKAAIEGRAALASLCYDHEDPGTAALGALHLLTQATLWTEEGPDFATEILAQHDTKKIQRVADWLEEIGEENAAYLIRTVDIPVEELVR